MENYEDDVLMSPEKMEQIVKKYKEELNKFDLRKAVIYKKITSNIEDLVNLFETFKLYGKSNFRKVYFKKVEKDINMLSEIYFKYTSKKITVDFIPKISCYKALKLLTLKLLNLIELSFEVNDKENFQIYLNLIKESIKHFN